MIYGQTIKPEIRAGQAKKIHVENYCTVDIVRAFSDRTKDIT